MRAIDADILGLTDMEIIMCNGNYKEAFKMLLDKIDNAPPIEPECKTGKWIKISPAGIYECSECGQNIMTNDIDCYLFCHGCGIKMRSE